MRDYKKIFLFFFSFQLLFSLSTEKLEEAKGVLKKGVDSWDQSLMEKARGIFLSMILTEKDENPYLYYYISLADYRLSTYFVSTQNKEKAERFIEEGISYLEKATQVAPSFSEAHALYASLLGIKIGLKPEEAMFLGMEIEKYFGLALDKSPENPRVNLLRGSSLLYTPEMFGGGAKNAIKFLEKAVSLFEKEKVDDPLKPSWGKEEAYTYLGVALEKLGEKEKAIQALEKALEANPDFSYARMQLERIRKEEK